MKIFKNSRTKRIASFVVCVLMLTAMLILPSPAIRASAETLESLKSQYNSLEKQIAKSEKKLAGVESDIANNEEKLVAINNQIESIKEQIAILDERMEVLNGSIDELEPQIEALAGEIDTLEKKIADLEEQITEAQDEAESTQVALLERIREDYMNGGSATNLEIILSSKGLSSFLARLELMDRVSENDARLISDLKQHAEELGELKSQATHEKSELELKKSQLDSKMEELNDDKADLQDSMDEAEYKQTALDSKQSQVQGLLSELDEDSAAYKKQIKRQRQQMEELAKEIDQYIADHGSSEGEGVPEEYQVIRTSDNLIWPVPYNNCRISCHYGYYSDGSRHWGTDIVIRDSNGNNISNGKDIVAAQSGEVILSVNDGNYNSGYGNYCIIDHGNGMMTLYCHCKRIVVSKGQVVKQGQKIAEIGLTGNTTGYHLHFEVRLKNSDGSVSRVNPENYVSCP